MTAKTANNDKRASANALGRVGCTDRLRGLKEKMHVTVRVRFYNVAESVVDDAKQV